MAAKKSKTKKPKKAASHATPSKKSKKLPPGRTAKKVAPKTTKKAGKAPARPTKKLAPKSKKRTRPAAAVVRPALSTAFADNMRDCVSGTPVWYTVAGGIEHAALLRRGTEGTLVILTDAGATVVVSPANLFETADEARAARNR
jgi:hypothetical protein